MAADGKEVHTESPRVLLPGYYRAGNSGANCCLQIRSTPRLTARRPHREISHPLVMAPCASSACAPSPPPRCPQHP
jgi:hypothetical protein